MRLVTIEEVLGYTSIESISQRGSKLSNDILRAEKKVFEICNHEFTDTEAYPTIPDEVKLSVILWTEYYALIELNKENEGFKKESLPDYSYERGVNIRECEPDTYLLLKKYISSTDPSQSRVVFKLRAF